MLSLNLTDSFNALLFTLVSVFKLLIEPLLLLILALIVTFWKIFYLPSTFVELLLDGVMNYVVGVSDCLLLLLTVVVSEITFGDVILVLLLLLILLLLLLLLLLLILFLSTDLNVIFVIDNLLELLLLLFDPYLDL